MADRSYQLMLQALSRAAAEGAVPLFASRNGTGLFPATTAGKQAAQRCRDEGYLHEDGTTCTLTEKGRIYLLDHVSPRQVLEDFVRALEARETQSEQLIDQVRQLQSTLEAMRQQIAPVLEQLYQPSLNGLFKDFHEESAPFAHPTVSILNALQQWRKSGATGDCPLPDLFRACSMPTIGFFHDALRQLVTEGRIYLHPWTGPKYAIPEPAFALLVGHDVAYYAALKEEKS